MAHLAEAKVCIAPLLSGSGTRFKILEAWAAGRAVVSTTLGAEGLGARDGEHLLLADDPDDFADAVLRLLERSAAAGAVRRCGLGALSGSIYLAGRVAEVGRGRRNLASGEPERPEAGHELNRDHVLRCFGPRVCSTVYPNFNTWFALGRKPTAIS